MTGRRWQDRARDELVVACVVTGFSVVVGVLVGLLWRWIAPEPAYVVVKGGAQLAENSAGASIAQDGWLAVLGIVAGTGCGVLAYLRFRARPVGALLGLVVGGSVAALVAWRVGTWIAPDPRAALGAHPSVGTRLEGGLRLRAKGVLLFWPIAAAVVVFALVGGLERPPRHGAAQGEGSPSDVAAGPGAVAATGNDDVTGHGVSARGRWGRSSRR